MFKMLRLIKASNYCWTKPAWALIILVFAIIDLETTSDSDPGMTTTTEGKNGTIDAIVILINTNYNVP